MGSYWYKNVKQSLKLQAKRNKLRNETLKDEDRIEYKSAYEYKRWIGKKNKT